MTHRKPKYHVGQEVHCINTDTGQKLLKTVVSVSLHYERGGTSAYVYTMEDYSFLKWREGDLTPATYWDEHLKEKRRIRVRHD